MQTLYLDDLDAHLGYHDLPGPEPACVYLHGLGSASSADYPMVARSARLAGHRAILVDLLGFGFSDRPAVFSHSLEAHADVVARLLDHLDLKRCRVIGHSWGGSIAVVLALRRQDLVGHLIVAEPNLEPQDATLSRSIADQSEAGYVAGGHARLIVQAEGWAADDPSVGSFASTLRVADPAAMHRAAKSLVAASLLSTLLTLDVPRSYLVGAQSLPDPHSEVLRQHGVRVAIIPGVGHAMVGQDPDGFATAVTAQFGPMR